MRFGVRSKAVENLEDVKTGLITVRRIIFTPNTDLKDELAKTTVQITCYDRNGNEVRRVTSSDPGNVEDPENEGGLQGAEGSQGTEGSEGSEGAQGAEGSGQD